MSEQRVEREQRVSPLEPFFDLVFVFGFTQVTMLLSDNPTWHGLGHAVLLLTALWWAWSAYAWLTQAVDSGEAVVWGTLIVAMAAMFVAALAVPEAFGRHGVVASTRWSASVCVWSMLVYLRAAVAVVHERGNAAPAHRSDKAPATSAGRRRRSRWPPAPPGSGPTGARPPTARVERRPEARSW